MTSALTHCPAGQDVALQDPKAVCTARVCWAITFVGPSSPHNKARFDDAFNYGAGDDVERPLRIVACVALEQLVVRVVPAVGAQPQVTLGVVSGFEAANIFCTTGQAVISTAARQAYCAKIEYSNGLHTGPKGLPLAYGHGKPV